MKIECFANLDASMKIRVGVYCISDCCEPYDKMSLYTLVAKNNVSSFEYYEFYDPFYLNKEVHKVQLEKQIEEGLRQDEFFVILQPKYCMRQDEICGAEALLRWAHSGEMISPSVFIPICEATGFVKEMDWFVFRKVCEFIKENLQKGNKMVPIAVNLSRLHMDHETLVDELDGLVEEYQIDRQWIQFEVTETSNEPSEEVFKSIVRQLQEKGYKVALDDFGCGYSSFQTFAEMEFDVVKLDKSFINRIGTQKGEDFIQFMVEIARQYQVEIVAEGVENKEQYGFLQKIGCDVIQGYYCSKPLQIQEFETLLIQGFSMKKAVNR